MSETVQARLEELEQRVIELTQQLESANAMLKEETDQHRSAEERVNLLNRDMETQKASIEVANRELESFIYSVSHDLQAPLRHISAFSQILIDDFKEQLTEEAIQHLNRIDRASSKMSRLINGLLTLSRLNRAEMNVSRIEMSALADNVAQALRDSDPSRPVSFHIGEDITADADPTLIKAALENLLDNAWKYTSKTTDAIIEFGCELQGNEQVFYLRDNGAGFDMEYADKLFTPFKRLHPAHEFDGAGIGLATVQRIIHRHGGRIWAAASPGQGATFYFTL
jgi:light-regulated signal transduction histidine kinase (bacteriophytochrome)